MSQNRWGVRETKTKEGHTSSIVCALFINMLNYYFIPQATAIQVFMLINNNKS